jgi:hypothetical protein
MRPIEEIKPGFYVQQTKTGWRVVKPIKKDLTRPFSFKNNVNWKHLLIGDWSRLITFLIVFAIILFAIWSYRHDMKACADKYASECMQAMSDDCFTKCSFDCHLQKDDLIKRDKNITNLTIKNGI